MRKYLCYQPEMSEQASDYTCPEFEGPFGCLFCRLKIIFPSPFVKVRF